MAYFRAAKKEDVDLLASQIRTGDVKELWHSHGMETKEALDISFSDSVEAFTIIYDEQPIGMFGYGEIDENIGVPWLLASDKLPEIAREFLRGSKEWIQDVLTKKYMLFNYVHADNKEAIRWLEWLGFKFLRRIENFGKNPAPFLEFVIIRED